jgi:hypothetical protein
MSASGPSACKEGLEDALGADSGVELRLDSPSTAPDRSAIDPAVLVAVVAAAGAGLPKLIECLFGMLTSKEKVVLKGKGGGSIEVPANTPDDRLRQLIGMAKTLDVEEVTLLRS